jgi:hypothetical protein
MLRYRDIPSLGDAGRVHNQDTLLNGREGGPLHGCLHHLPAIRSRNIRCIHPILLGCSIRIHPILVPGREIQWRGRGFLRGRRHCKCRLPIRLCRHSQRCARLLHLYSRLHPTNTIPSVVRPATLPTGAHPIIRSEKIIKIRRRSFTPIMGIIVNVSVKRYPLLFGGLIFDILLSSYIKMLVSSYFRTFVLSCGHLYIIGTILLGLCFRPVYFMYYMQL